MAKLKKECKTDKEFYIAMAIAMDIDKRIKAKCARCNASKAKNVDKALREIGEICMEQYTIHEFVGNYGLQMLCDAANRGR